MRPDPLFAQVFRRHTNRSPYEMRPPSAQALQAIREAMEGFPVTAGLPIRRRPPRCTSSARSPSEAWRIELSTPRTLLESYKVLRVGPKEITQHRDGLSLNDPMVRFAHCRGLVRSHTRLGA